jgi:hypothetical protein
MLGLLSTAAAQSQERSLVDRLLKPDMNLRNSAQNKKFLADGASVDKRATVTTFYLRKTTKEKSFAGTRDFSTKPAHSRSFHERNRTDVASKKRSSDSSATYPTSSASGVRNAHDSQKSAGSADFAGQRPFLAQGKSQKSLNRKNPPLTIEQVRELLNKNK